MMKEENKKKRIEIRISENEYLAIKNEADKKQKAIAKFVKDTIFETVLGLKETNDFVVENTIPKKKSFAKKRIEIRFNDKEYFFIKREANRAKKQITTYIKDAIFQCVSVNYDYSFLELYINKISELHNDVNRLVLTILCTGEYFPSDLEIIQNSMAELVKNKNEILKEIRKEKNNMIKKFNRTTNENE